MVPREFGDTIKELCIYYERKKPTDASMDAWYKKVCRIENEAIPWIIDKIEDQINSFPQNIPATLLKYWDEWITSNRSNPIHDKSSNSCPECNGGLIHAYKIINNVRCMYVFACDTCKQCKFTAFPLKRKNQIIQSGYKLVDFMGDVKKQKLKWRLNKIIDSVGKEISSAENNITRDKKERED